MSVFTSHIFFSLNGLAHLDDVPIMIMQRLDIYHLKVIQLALFEFYVTEQESLGKVEFSVTGIAILDVVRIQAYLFISISTQLDNANLSILQSGRIYHFYKWWINLS